MSIAKAYVGDAGTQLAQQCLQVHGGIGFTWEHDLHFYLRRLAADRVLYGDPEWHRERDLPDPRARERNGMTATTTDETISVDDFRARARAWLAANCERKTAEADRRRRLAARQHEFTKEQIDAERPKQKRLYEAGFAGITWPAEFGGQGLTGAHELAFSRSRRTTCCPTSASPAAPRSACARR